MVYVFEIRSPEFLDFKRLIHINPNDAFEDLHLIIQNTSNFDQSQLASFFLTDDHWRKQLEFSQLDSGKSLHNTFSMCTTKLNQYISAVGQKLVYVFDFFNERYLYVELKEMLMKTDIKEPFVAYERGTISLVSPLPQDSELDLPDKIEVSDSFGDLEDYYEVFGELDS